jgi:hypothetical protein
MANCSLSSSRLGDSTSSTWPRQGRVWRSSGVVLKKRVCHGCNIVKKMIPGLGHFWPGDEAPSPVLSIATVDVGVCWKLGSWDSVNVKLPSRCADPPSVGVIVEPSPRQRGFAIDFDDADGTSVATIR